VLQDFFGWHLKGAQSHPFSIGWTHKPVLNVFFKYFLNFLVQIMVPALLHIEAMINIA
jgi:hypothetical protein